MIRLLLISGSLRAGSTNTAALHTAAAVAPDGVDAERYEGMARLPHFNPDDDDPEGVRPLHAAVADLRARLAAVDAVLFSTPEYAGGMPGSFKNLLDWTVGGGETYGKPAGYLNLSGPASPTGAAGAHASLRSVLTYTGVDLVEAACVRVPVLRGAVDEADGQVADPGARAAIAAAVTALAGYAAPSTT